MTGWSPEHADCNRSFYGRDTSFIWPDLEEVDPEAVLYTPPVTMLNGVEHRWWLLDVEEEHRRHPETFFIPSAGRRRALRVGESVRLIFGFSPRASDQPRAERMWIRVAGADERGFVGYLTNRPACIVTLEPGATIGFEARHVASVEVTHEEVGFGVEEIALVSMRVAEGAWPRSLVREPPGGRQPTRRDADGWEMVDSGWQVLSGDEPDAELDRPDAIVLWPLGWLVERFPAVLAPIASGAASGRWSWDGDREAYAVAADP